MISLLRVSQIQHHDRSVNDTGNQKVILKLSKNIIWVPRTLAAIGGMCKENCFLTLDKAIKTKRNTDNSKQYPFIILKLTLSISKRNENYEVMLNPIDSFSPSQVTTSYALYLSCAVASLENFVAAGFFVTLMRCGVEN